MDEGDVRNILQNAVERLLDADRYLLENDLSERCIAARLAMYLQDLFDGYAVDVEYNRAGEAPKRLGLPEECGNYYGRDGVHLAVPDLIVHRRGSEGPNILVLEMKKTTNPETQECDRLRVHAFRDQLGYEFGALVTFETRPDHEPGVAQDEWISG